MLLAGLWLASAHAAEPADDADYEITVYGQGAQRQARWDAILALKKMGWEMVERNGRTRFKPPRTWMGRAGLTDDGELVFNYPVLKFRNVSAVETSGSNEPGAFQRQPGGMVLTDASGQTSTLPAGRAGLWLLPSRTILGAAYDRVRKQVQPELDAIARIERDTRVRKMIDRIPERLDTLWTEGRGMDGSVGLTMPQRTDAILRYWSGQPLDFEGLQIVRTTEAWMRANWLETIELTAAQQAIVRPDGRTLDDVQTRAPR
jgi:hypothetical protein